MDLEKELTRMQGRTSRPQGGAFQFGRSSGLC